MSSETYFKIIEEVSQRVKDEFGGFSVDQLNWKPAPDKWSIGQCIDHLITTNSSYFSTLDLIISGQYKEGLWAKLSPFTNYFGKVMIKTLGPERRKAFKTPPVFRPSQSNINGDIVEQFLENNKATILKFSKLSEQNAENVIIHSPASSFITYRVDHTLGIIARHEQRHFLQMMDVSGLLPSKQP